jgi:hypothetical protein
VLAAAFSMGSITAACLLSFIIFAILGVQVVTRLPAAVPGRGLTLHCQAPPWQYKA